MKKNFFKWAVLFTALATALTFSSCGNDDDEEENNGENNEQLKEDDEAVPSYQFLDNSIEVKAGDVILYAKVEKGTITNEYEEFSVVSAKAGEVVLKINGKQVTLSDAGASYLSEDFKEWKTADAKADPAKVLLCLKGNQTNTIIIDGTLAGNSTISEGATPTFFRKK
jgi:hypothetical protein